MALCPRCAKPIPQQLPGEEVVADYCMCDPDEVEPNAMERKITWRTLIQQRKDAFERKAVPPVRPKGTT